MKKDFKIKDFPEAEAIKILLDRYLIKADKKTRIKTIILLMAGAGILAYVGSPALAAFSVIKAKIKNGTYNKKQISNSLGFLKRSDLVRQNLNKGKLKILLTPKGYKEINFINIDLIKINRPKEWDKKWRVVMFDIPVRFNKGREGLRWKLKELGFFQLQKSVWVYPHDCIKEIAEIASFWGVGKYIELMLVENMSNEQRLRTHFNLS